MEEKLIALIADKLGKDVSTVKLESRLVEDLGADSLDIVEMMLAFEDEFGIALPDEMIPNIKTVGDIVKAAKDLKN